MRRHFEILFTDEDRTQGILAKELHDAAQKGRAVDEHWHLKTGDTQWIGHILKRLHLIDESRRKRQTDGILYAVSPGDVLDMMARYHVAHIELAETKNRS